jgi:hypothetical protein
VDDERFVSEEVCIQWIVEWKPDLAVSIDMILE